MNKRNLLTAAVIAAVAIVVFIALLPTLVMQKPVKDWITGDLLARQGIDAYFGGPLTQARSSGWVSFPGFPHLRRRIFGHGRTPLRTREQRSSTTQPKTYLLTSSI